MSANSSTKLQASQPAEEEAKIARPTFGWRLLFILPLWVLASFGLAQAAVVGVFLALRSIGLPLDSVNSSVGNAVLAACIYVLSVAIVIGVPWWIKKYRTTIQEIGLARWPSWMDLGMAPTGLIVYLIFSAILIAVMSALVPGIDMNQVQNTGFADVSHRYEYILAFITLILIAPLFEEILFRGYLYGKLRKVVPMWVTILAVSLLFAAVHGQWNVGIDVFALSIVLCGLREMTGNIWAGVLLHMLKNSIAFYFLFINPDILRTIGG